MKQITTTALILLATIEGLGQTTSGQECVLPFFSEMIDGQASNKVLEIFNPSNVPINASNLAVLQFMNGSPIPTVIALSGVIASKGTHVLANPNADPAILANTNQTSNNLNFNGNDALALVQMNMLPPDLNELSIPTGAFIDIIGEIGTNPSSNGWPVGSGSTSGHCLIRQQSVTAPTTNWQVGQTQWTAFPATHVTNLQQHQSACRVLQATVGFVEVSFSFNEDIGNTVLLDILVSGAHDDIDIFVQSGASFTGCGPDFADGTDFNIVTSSIHVPASSGGEIVQAEIILVDDNTVEADESICLDLNCLSVSQNCFVDQNACCHELVIIDNDGMGMEDKTFSDLKLYPTLAENTLHIDGVWINGGYSFSISNTMGQTILQQSQTIKQSKDVSLDISTLEKGMYFITLNQQNSTITKKFIKQ